MEAVVIVFGVIFVPVSFGGAFFLSVVDDGAGTDSGFVCLTDSAEFATTSGFEANKF